MKGYSQTDSVSMMFEPFSVHSYNLEFYTDDWQEQLLENYEYGIYLPAKLTYNEIVLDSIGVRYKGNSSYTESGASPKKPFKFKFDAFREEQTFFGMSKLSFTNNVKDPSYMRESIAYALARKYEPAPRTSYAKISLEGEYIGLYTQVEQVDTLFLDKYSERLGNSDGNLFKASSDGGILIYRGADQTDYYNEYEIQTNKVINDWSRFVEMIDVLNNSSDEDFAEEISEYLDMESCIRYLAFCQVLSHFDSYLGSSRNFYFYENSDNGRFTMLIWDVDRSFGGFSNGWDVIEADIANVNCSTDKPLTRRILANDSLKQVYFSYIDEMINGHCSPDTVTELAFQYKDFLDTLVKEDPNCFMSYKGFQNSLYTDSTAGFNVILGIISFAEERYNALSKQLEEYSEVPVTNPAYSQNVNSKVSLSFNNICGSVISVRCSDDIGKGELSIFMPNGRQVVKKEFNKLKKGFTNIDFSNSGISAGFYLVTLKTDSFKFQQKGFIH